MTTAEIRAAQMLNVTEEGLRKIQEAHKLFPGLWDDEAFIELWKALPDEVCSALFTAVEKIEEADEKYAKKSSEVYRLQKTIHDCAERLVFEYAEDNNETTKDVAINAVGEKEFYAMLIEGGYDLNEYDREDIAALLR